MKLLNSLIICFALFLYGCGDTVYASEILKPDSVVRVHDGDTFSVNIGGCPDVLCQHLSVRINGIDAPEMRGKCSQEKAMAVIARNYLSSRILNAGDVELRNVSRDKYFRINADVFADGVNVGADMISNGLARSYGGGKRGGWCDTS